jgi:hypothetical protein
MDQVAPTFSIPKWGIFSIPRWGIYYIDGGGMGVVEFIPPPYHPLYIFLCPCPNMISKEQQMRLKWGIYSIPRWVYIIYLGGGMGVALHDRLQTTTTTLDGKAFTANKVQSHGCYQPTPMGNTPYGHSMFIKKILTWVQGRLGLVALHDRVKTTTTTSDGKAFTAIKVQSHGCYQPTPIGNPLYGHSIFITKILTWVQGRLGLVALHDKVKTTTTNSDPKVFTANKVQ